jgi:hypothetical protein
MGDLMKFADIDRLRGDAPKTTHLARYERANDEHAKHVRDVTCPDCGVLSGFDCGKMDS